MLEEDCKQRERTTSFAQDELPKASQACDASPDLGEHGEPDTCLSGH